ncbi:hypothetical protein PR001_g24733, partial [Phytophthora rubi]
GTPDLRCGTEDAAADDWGRRDLGDGHGHAAATTTYITTTPNTGTSALQTVQETTTDAWALVTDTDTRKSLAMTTMSAGISAATSAL